MQKNFMYEKIENDYHLPMKLLRFDDCAELGGVKKHWHNSIEILIPIVEDIKLWQEGDDYIIRENQDIHIINSGDIHGFDPRTGYGEHLCYTVQINYQFLKSYYPLLDSFYFKQPDNMVRDKMLKDIMEIVQSYDQKNDYYKDIKIKSCLISLLYTMLSYLAVKKDDYYINMSQKNKALLNGITNYIDCHYQDELTVSLIAEQFSISQGTLFKLFREHLQISVRKYISSQRLKQARIYIIETDLPIIDIVYACGFPNIKSFQKDFKERYKMTPIEFRNRMRK